MVSFSGFQVLGLKMWFMHGKIKNLESFRCYLRCFGSDAADLIKFWKRSVREITEVPESHINMFSIL